MGEDRELATRWRDLLWPPEDCLRLMTAKLGRWDGGPGVAYVSGRGRWLAAPIKVLLHTPQGNLGFGPIGSGNCSISYVKNSFMSILKLSFNSNKFIF